MINKDRFSGCLLGLALGDAIGAPYEGGILEKLIWKLICISKLNKKRWTDDTQMSIDLALSLVINEGLNLNHLAGQFANSYKWSRGYGPATAKILKKIKKGGDWKRLNRSVYQDGSYGNGAAMRAPVIGLFYNHDLDVLIKSTRDSASITHAHPIGIEGAVLIAAATSFSLNSFSPIEIIQQSRVRCKQKEFTIRLSIANKWISEKTTPSAKEVVEKLGNHITAEGSAVTALYISLHYLDKPFEDMLDFIIQCGGDVDTIAAMAGAIWGAKRGVSDLPEDYLKNLEQNDRINNIANDLFNTWKLLPKPE